MSEALVQYDYTARSPDELTIKKGDIIRDVINVNFGWAEGTLNDKRGMFPENYVKYIDKDVIYRNKNANTASLRQCKVIFSYQPVHPDELILNTGDIIDIIGEDEEGWWRGMLNGKEGVFPSNFVEEIFPAKPKQENRDSLDIINDVRIPSLPPKPQKILCEVKYAYKAQNDDELTLKEGDIVTLLNKDLADPGWWEGELNGKVGVFPDNFVAIIKHSEETPNKDDTKTNSTLELKTTATVSQRTSLDANKIDEKIDDNKTNPPLIHKKPVLPKKKSPSSTTKGFLSGIVNRKSETVVDGIASSKSYHLKNDVKLDVKDLKKENKENGENPFDEVERNPLLKDVRAGRAKPPIRRPPTSGVVTKDKQSIAETENIIVSSEDETPDTKPAPVREWEKHKAPWLEEMKMNQAKRSSTSPVSEKNLNTKGLYPELDKSPIDNVMSKSMPCPAISKVSPIDTNEIDITDVEETVESNAGPKKPAKLQDSFFRKYPANTTNSTVNSTITTTTTTTAKHFASSTNKYKSTTINNEKSNQPNVQNIENRGSGDFAQQETITLTVTQYSNLLDRLQRLEVLLEKQTTALEDLKAKFYLECDKRKLLEAEYQKIKK